MWVSGVAQCLLSSVITALVFVRLFCRLLESSMAIFSLHFTYLENSCLTVRAYHKIKELQRLLEIAYSNYRQLGGITEEDRKMKKEERKVEK